MNTIQRNVTGKSLGVEPLVVRPNQAMHMLDVGRAYLYELINAGELESYGKSTVQLHLNASPPKAATSATTPDLGPMRRQSLPTRPKPRDTASAKQSSKRR